MSTLPRIAGGGLVSDATPDQIEQGKEQLNALQRNSNDLERKLNAALKAAEDLQRAYEKSRDIFHAKKDELRKKGWV